MAEFTKKFWRCDHCGREVQRGVMPPPGWFEALSFYGPVFHACREQECRHAAKVFLENNYPSDCSEDIKELEATK